MKIDEYKIRFDEYNKIGPRFGQSKKAIFWNKKYFKSPESNFNKCHKRSENFESGLRSTVIKYIETTSAKTNYTYAN